MSLIQCPECGFSVSQTAPSCPNCGCKIADNLTTCKECGRTILKTSRECPSCHCVNENFVEHTEETDNTLAEEQQKALKSRYAQVLVDEKKGRYKNALDAVNVLLLEYPQSKTFQDLKKRIVAKYVSKCLENADLNIRIRKYDEAMQLVEDGLLADRNNADLKKMMVKINKKKQGKTIKRLFRRHCHILDTESHSAHQGARGMGAGGQIRPGEESRQPGSGIGTFHARIPQRRSVPQGGIHAHHAEERPFRLATGT